MANINSLAPSPNGAEVTPSDTAGLEEVSGQVLVGTAGNLSVVMANGQELTIPVSDGALLYIAVKQIKSTGTTASNIFVFW